MFYKARDNCDVDQKSAKCLLAEKGGWSSPFNIARIRFKRGRNQNSRSVDMMENDRSLTRADT
jgi:hypothetical protein